jgi:hypothetical protein
MRHCRYSSGCQLVSWIGVPVVARNRLPQPAQYTWPHSWKAAIALAPVIGAPHPGQIGPAGRYSRHIHAQAELLTTTCSAFSIVTIQQSP